MSLTVSFAEVNTVNRPSCVYNLLWDLHFSVRTYVLLLHPFMDFVHTHTQWPTWHEDDCKNWTLGCCKFYMSCGTHMNNDSSWRGEEGGHPCLVYHKLTNYLQLFDDMVEGCCNFTYMHTLVSLCTFQLQSVCERCPLLKSLSWAHLGPAKCRTYNLQQWCIGDLNFYVLFITAFPNSVVVDDGSSGREVYDSLDTTSCYTVCNWERKSYRALGCLL